MNEINRLIDLKPLSVVVHTPPEATSEKSLTRLRGLRILVIDDHPFARAMIRNVLQALGIWMVTECKSAKEGIVLLTKEPFDLVLVDKQMPKVSGIAFTRTVRRSDLVKNPAIKIIMVSSHSDVSTIKEGLDAGIHDFLAKPYSATSLAQRLCASLDDERPFIQEPGYAGPCRRRPLWKNRPYREDRRQAVRKESVA